MLAYNTKIIRDMGPKPTKFEQTNKNPKIQFLPEKNSNFTQTEKKIKSSRVSNPKPWATKSNEVPSGLNEQESRS